MFVDLLEFVVLLFDIKGIVVCNVEVIDDRNCWVVFLYRLKVIWYVINVWFFCYSEEKNKFVNFFD